MINSCWGFVKCTRIASKSNDIKIMRPLVSDQQHVLVPCITIHECFRAISEKRTNMMAVWWDHVSNISNISMSICKRINGIEGNIYQRYDGDVWWDHVLTRACAIFSYGLPSGLLLIGR